MKPCTYEQDVFFVIHGEATLLQKIRVWRHCLTCEDCKRRRAEFIATTRLLLTLRPAPVAVSAGYRPSRKNKLILCSAVMALAAAAVSYYAAFGNPFGPPPESCGPSPKAAAVREDDACADPSKVVATKRGRLAPVPSASKNSIRAIAP